MDRIVDERALLEKKLALFLPEVALENMPPIPLGLESASLT